MLQDKYIELGKAHVEAMDKIENLTEQLRVAREAWSEADEFAKKVLSYRSCTSHKIGECPSIKETSYVLASRIIDIAERNKRARLALEQIREKD